jgi:UDP-N-acetylmuramyl pentapeptide phosphotransferase/UDP-N-acetylglucosamine-1-phosphate transferase
MELNQTLYFFLIGLLLVAIELIYFRVAIRFSIVDKPNSRSSHVKPAIRGGGVIFVFAILTWFVSHDFLLTWFVLGACAIAVISFLDDVMSLNPLVRFLIQLLAVLFVFYQLWPISWPIYLLVLAVIFCIGTLNAFNFMDGINGITGVYALVALISFFYIHTQVVAFTELSLIIVISISILVFLFFNFRKRAQCFAGDVGSVTIAFVLIFLLLQLILATNNFLWPLLFLIYGTDSIVTIIFRIKRKENIFKPHRTHLFQYLSNELAWPHLTVSLTYGVVQLLFNVMLFFTLSRHQYVVPIISAVAFLVAYLIIRIKIMQYISKSGSKGN